MRPRVWALSLTLLLGLATGGHAQDLQLRRVLDRLAASWTRGDAAQIATLVATPGLSLAVDDDPVGPLGRRQAAAVLRRMFEVRETISLRTGMTRVVGGTPPRAFGEWRWVSRVRGTTVPERTTVFLALVREPRGWRVTEIRLLP